MIGWVFLAVVIVIVVGLLPYACSRRARNFFDHDKLGKKIFAIWMTFSALNIALWPAWLFMLLRLMLTPVGFWQNLLLTGLGLYFLGALQIYY